MRNHYIPIKVNKIQNTQQHQMPARMWSRRSSDSLLVRRQNCKATGGFLQNQGRGEGWGEGKKEREGKRKMRYKSESH